MSSIKITELTELTEADNNDLFPVVDITDGTTKKVRRGALIHGVFTGELLGSVTTSSTAATVNYSKSIVTYENIIGLYVTIKNSAQNSTCGTFVPYFMLGNLTNLYFDAKDNSNNAVNVSTIPYQNSQTAMYFSLTNPSSNEFVISVYSIFAI
jgi:hypothetical protein